MQFISAQDINATLSWKTAIEALERGHQGARPLGDQYFIGDATFGLFSRGVILPGYGAGIKLASIYPQNVQAQPPLPAEHAAFVVFDQTTKAVTAILDGPAITCFKTAADSALASQYLSRPDSYTLLVIGAGPVARALVQAHLQVRPGISEVLLWNRSAEKLYPLLDSLQQQGINASIAPDLATAVSRADIISTATSATSPVIKGRWVKPGTHIDLVGGYRPDMQEADSALLQKARIFVDDRAAALLSGDIAIPLQSGEISEQQIEADLFELCQGSDHQRTDGDITVYKNAGGAHLDLMMSQCVIDLLKGGLMPG